MTTKKVKIFWKFAKDIVRNDSFWYDNFSFNLETGILLVTLDGVIYKTNFFKRIVVGVETYDIP